MSAFRKDISYGKESLEELLFAHDLRHLPVEHANDYPRTDWDPIDFVALADRFGADRVSLAAAASAERQYFAEPLSGSPPVLFISYRRADLAVVEWVGRLRDHLTGLGYDVLLDYIDTDADAGVIGTEIPRFVARLAGADVFLPVVTRAYTAEADRPWIFAERKLAYLQAIRARMQIVTVLVEDTPLPDGWSYFFPVADLRAGPDDFAPLAALLPPVTSRLSDADKVVVREMTREAEKQLLAGQSAELEAFLRGHDRFRHVHEWREFMHYALAMQGRDADAAAVLPESELRSVRLEDTQFRLAQFFRATGQTHQALQLLWQFYRGGPTFLGHYVRAHHLAADILEDQGSYLRGG